MAKQVLSHQAASLAQKWGLLIKFLFIQLPLSSSKISKCQVLL